MRGARWACMGMIHGGVGVHFPHPLGGLFVYRGSFTPLHVLSTSVQEFLAYCKGVVVIVSISLGRL